MDFFLDFTSGVMDAFLLTVYFRTVLGKIRNNRRFLYVCALIAVELILYFYQLYLVDAAPFEFQKVITVSLSVITTFLISLFYEAKIYIRIFYSILFQLLSAFAESIFTWLITNAQPDLMSIENGQMLYAIMSFGITVTFFLLIMILNLVKRILGYSTPPLRFHILLLLPPVLTLLILSLLKARAFYASGNFNLFIFLIVTLTLINAINYIEIEWSARYLTDRERMIQMERQIDYQKEKYDQLSNSYRQSRSFLHDIRKHFFTMQEYIKTGKTSELSEYIEQAFGEMEQIYARYNTGNLVIDSFLTTYASMAEQHAIRFDATLRLDKDRIPLEDYDLCVVLGNILDNAITASTHAPTADRYIRITIETTANDLFLIQQENTMSSSIQPADSSHRLEHGYGLVNIERTLDRYHGLMSYTTGDEFRIYIRVPITDPKQRLTKPTDL